MAVVPHILFTEWYKTLISFYMIHEKILINIHDGKSRNGLIVINMENRISQSSLNFDGKGMNPLLPADLVKN